MALPSDLQRLDERPQQRPNALPFTQQLDQSHHSEQAEEGDGHTGAVLATLTARRRGRDGQSDGHTEGTKETVNH